MVIVLALFAAALVALSMYGVLLPSRLVGLVRDFMSGGLGLWFAVAVRVALAALLWVNAPVSSTPAIFKVLAVMVFLAAITLPIIGTVRLGKFIGRLATWPHWAIRLQCFLGVALGGLLHQSLSSSSPRRGRFYVGFRRLGSLWSGARQRRDEMSAQMPLVFSQSE